MLPTIQLEKLVCIIKGAKRVVKHATGKDNDLLSATLVAAAIDGAQPGDICGALIQAEADGLRRSQKKRRTERRR